MGKLKSFFIFYIKLLFKFNFKLLVLIPRYLIQLKSYIKLGGFCTSLFPILNDYKSDAGLASGHYFHQDLLVASLIHFHKPKKHLDIGSRIDGFIAHLASFRKVFVMDIRKLKNSGHANISFIQADLMKPQKNIQTDSISCLHAIEHFGLGRYGDPINPNGHIEGFNNILKLLKKNGIIYISFPIGRANEVHFNAHRVFHPMDIFSWAINPASLKLLRFDYIDDAGDIHQNINLHKAKINLKYGCGIYTFKKLF